MASCRPSGSLPRKVCATARQPGGPHRSNEYVPEPEHEGKAAHHFGSDRAYREFAADVAHEAQIKNIQGIGQDAQTAERQSGMGDLELSAMNSDAHALGSAKGGNLLQ